jgi:hypothetical protein
MPTAQLCPFHGFLDGLSPPCHLSLFMINSLCPNTCCYVMVDPETHTHSVRIDIMKNSFVIFCSSALIILWLCEMSSVSTLHTFSTGGFFIFFFHIYYCIFNTASDFTVSEDAGIEPRIVATSALAVRRSNPRLDLIYPSIMDEI